MVTISDVAKHAGVSMMTVSRVINNNAHVSEITKRKVKQAIDDLGYRPNMVARGLATKHSHMIAYVMSNIANPFFSKVSAGIQKVCVANGYTMILYDVTDAQRLEDCFDMLIERKIDGVVFHHLDITEEHVKKLSDNDICCVTIDNERELKDTISVDSDDYDAARMVTRYLIDQGYKRIGCIHGRFEETPVADVSVKEFTESFQRRIWRDRTQGFLDELTSVEYKPACLVEGRGSVDFTIALEKQRLQKVLSPIDRPDALYCENDILALAVLGECLEQGIRVPQEVAIIGHDGLDFGMMLYPRLTTACQPRYEMGVLSATKLIEAIEKSPGVQHIITRSKVFHGDTA